MVPRHKIDISAADLLFALLACVTARSPASEERAALDALGIGEDEGLACLSVRSGLDLLLEALRLPAGSELVVSAVTHLDMARILERHGIVAVPVDLDPATLEPRIDLLEAAVTGRTRALLVAHLFGSTMRLAPIAEVARRHDLLLVEDCAQSLGASPRGGDRLADVSMFSLGPIKTATALGGAVLRVADPELLGRMRAIQAARPVQRRSAYAARAVRFAGLAVVARPLVYGALARVVDLDRLVAGSVRGFPGGRDDLFERLRARPSAPLLATMRRRLCGLDLERIAARARAGEELGALLTQRVMRPGAGADRRTHWVFPVLAPHPEAFVAALRSAGFDAARGTTSIGVVPAPPDRPELDPHEARRLMRDIVFLPAYLGLGARRRQRLAAAANGALVETEAREPRVPALP
jgi:dTDP-4-amino-4,6-dideoxygalactose transaminase